MIHGNQRASARAIFGDHRLFESGLKALGNHSCTNIIDAAGRKRAYHRNRA
jgi:hypothetical protein